MEILILEKCKAEEFSDGKMEVYMRGSTKIIKNMVLENILIKMEKRIKEDGEMVTGKVKEL